ncbi:MAG: hypothetical protein WCA04_03345 [Geobacteraceae bacterium]
MSNIDLFTLAGIEPLRQPIALVTGMPGTFIPFKLRQLQHVDCYLLPGIA